MKYSLLFVAVSLLVALALARPMDPENQPGNGDQSRQRQPQQGMRGPGRGDRKGSDLRDNSG